MASYLLIGNISLNFAHSEKKCVAGGMDAIRTKNQKAYSYWDSGSCFYTLS